MNGTKGFEPSSCVLKPLQPTPLYQLSYVPRMGSPSKVQFNLSSLRRIISAPITVTASRIFLVKSSLPRYISFLQLAAVLAFDRTLMLINKPVCVCYSHPKQQPIVFRHTLMWARICTLHGAAQQPTDSRSRVYLFRHHIT